jgi:hypothetical protein
MAALFRAYMCGIDTTVTVQVPQAVMPLQVPGSTLRYFMIYSLSKTNAEVVF